jgi:hypothetical protein
MLFRCRRTLSPLERRISRLAAHYPEGNAAPAAYASTVHMMKS